MVLVIGEMCEAEKDTRIADSIQPRLEVEITLSYQLVSVANNDSSFRSESQQAEMPRRT
jgi:hypothetical protein